MGHPKPFKALPPGTLLSFLWNFLVQSDAYKALPEVSIEPFQRFLHLLVSPEQEELVQQELGEQQHQQNALLQRMRHCASEAEEQLCKYPAFLTEVATFRQRAQDPDLQEAVGGSSWELRLAIAATAADTLQRMHPYRDPRVTEGLSELQRTGALRGPWRKPMTLGAPHESLIHPLPFCTPQLSRAPPAPYSKAPKS